MKYSATVFHYPPHQHDSSLFSYWKEDCLHFIFIYFRGTNKKAFHNEIQLLAHILLHAVVAMRKEWGAGDSTKL